MRIAEELVPELKELACSRKKVFPDPAWHALTVTCFQLPIQSYDKDRVVVLITDFDGM